jgi:putative lipoprotein
VEINGSSMTMGPLAGTRKACPDALMDQENKFFRAMSMVVAWEIPATGLLHLRDAAGNSQLRASRIEP